MTWEIVARPRGENVDGHNKGGIVILLKRAGSSYTTEEEVERVAFDRSEAANPDVDFDTQLESSIAKAEKSVEKLNELLAKAGELQ